MNNRLPNLARRKEDTDAWILVDQQVLTELTKAKITVVGPHEWLRTRNNTEVPTSYLGQLCKWSFERSWYYWRAKGPGIPSEVAEGFHKTWGQEVRVDGHCGCPSPAEMFEGFAVGVYHIDTQEGLTAFAELLRSIHKPFKKEENFS